MMDLIRYLHGRCVNTKQNRCVNTKQNITMSLDVKYFVGEYSRIKDGLQNHGINANDVINIESLPGESLDFLVKVWYRTK